MYDEGRKFVYVSLIEKYKYIIGYIQFSTYFVPEKESHFDFLKLVCEILKFKINMNLFDLN